MTTRSFYPDGQTKPRNGKRKHQESYAWVAPEHIRQAKQMDRDNYGNLVQERRPTSMIPPRPTIMGYL